MKSEPSIVEADLAVLGTIHQKYDEAERRSKNVLSGTVRLVAGAVDGKCTAAPDKPTFRAG